MIHISINSHDIGILCCRRDDDHDVDDDGDDDDDVMEVLDLWFFARQRHLWNRNGFSRVEEITGIRAPFPVVAISSFPEGSEASLTVDGQQ